MALPRLKSGSLLHHAERRTSFIIKRDNLSIENGALSIYRFRQSGKLRKLRSQIILITRNQTQPSIFNKRDGAVAIPLQFEEPIGVVESLGNRRRQHRVDDGWHRLLHRASEGLNRGGR